MAAQTPAMRGRRGRILLLLVLFIIGMIIVLLMRVTVIHATDEDARTLLKKRIEPGAEMTSSYLHSVEKCPMVEKFHIDRLQIVLDESWNCNFGAGIEASIPEGAKGAFEDGFYKIRSIDKHFEEIQFHPVKIARQQLQIDDETWNLYEKPFVGETFTLKSERMSIFTYLLK